ncbi:extracellular solute-binding protein [Salinibaculum rarum]|uniref:ABC transporter substrate-binding protein n=1 Tax=Salinibaculum rarum TaxID=3058903 RepID=UPI00265D75F2|nr:ABC transporter substrate-binding protein [Salinibaculum sp. KK48]
MTDSRRNFIKKAGIATAATTSFAGCLGGGGGGSSSNTVHFLSAENSQAFKDYYKKWAGRFEEEHDHEVKLEFVGVGTSQSSRISKLLQSGNPPELTTTAPEKGGGLALQGVLADLSDEAEWMEDEWGYDFNDNFLFQLQGKQYVVPIWVNMTMDWYRVSTWEENTGMTPREMEWEEFRQALSDTNGVGERAGHVIPAGSSLMSTEFYIDYMFGNDGQIFERNGEEIELVMDKGENLEKTKEVLQFFEDTQQYSLDGSGYGYSQQIESYWSEQVNEVKYFGARPLQQAVSNNKAVAEDTGLMQPPYKEEKTHQAFSEGWVMFQGADNKEGAREFVKFMSRKEPLIELLHIAPLHNLPPFPDAVDDEEFLDNEFINKWVEPNENIQIDNVVEMVNNASTLVGETDPNNALASPVFSSGAFGNMIFNYLHGDMGLEESINNAASQSRSILDQFEN